MRTPALFAVAFLAAACSSGDGNPAATPSNPAAAGKCSDVVNEDATVTDLLIDQGCIDDTGSKRMGTVKLCKDGRRLWSMNGMIGRTGEKMIRADMDVLGRRADQIVTISCNTQTGRTASTPPAPTTGS